MNSVKDITSEKLVFSIIIGSIVSFVITFLLFIIFSASLVNSNLSSDYFSTIVIFTSIISVLFASIFVGRKSSTRGWFNGGIIGIVYVVVLFAIRGVFFSNISLSVYMISMLFICFFSGAFGGIIGINLKRRKRY